MGVAGCKTFKLGLLVFLLLSMFAFGFTKVPPEVVKAAKQGLYELPMLRAELLKSVPASASAEVLKKVKLGAFFQVYTVEPQVLLTTQEENISFGALARPTEMWRVIVVFNNRAHSLLTMGKVDGKWQVVTWGAKGLSKELYALREKWPAKKNYKLRFIRVYQARADVVQIIDASGKSKGYVPLVSARVAFSLPGEFDPFYTMSEADVFHTMKKTVEKNMRLEK